MWLIQGATRLELQDIAFVVTGEAMPKRSELNYRTAREESDLETGKDEQGDTIRLRAFRHFFKR